MNTIKQEIEKVEKELKEMIRLRDIPDEELTIDELDYWNNHSGEQFLKGKLQALKFAQAEHEKFVEKLKRKIENELYTYSFEDGLYAGFSIIPTKKVIEIIDELNSQNDVKDNTLARTPEQETRGSRDMAEHLGENPSSGTHSQHRITTNKEQIGNSENLKGQISDVVTNPSADKIQGCGKQFFALRGTYICGNGFYCNDCKIDCSKKLNSGSKE